jgi:hypothetical protein
MGLFACASADTGTSSSDSAETVGSSAADLVDAVWRETDYLPWEYAPDGCFARSFYVAMEFAARGVPVSQEVINLRWEQTSSFRPRFDAVDPRLASPAPVRFQGNVVTWDYHIAALLLPPVVPEPTIIDRALEPKPVPLETWVNHANAGASPQPLSETMKDGTPTPGFNEFSTFGSQYVGLEPSLSKNWNSVSSPDLATFHPFEASSIQLACDTLTTVYDCLKAGSEDPRRSDLQRRTTELVSALDKAKLVKGWDGKPISCKPTSTFACVQGD